MGNVKEICVVNTY